MDPWIERLGPRRQTRLLRSLAATALAAYDLPAARLSLVAHRHNTIFRLETVEGQRYALRIHPAAGPTIESVGAEMAWLAAISRDTTLEVPAPVLTRGGQLLTLAAAPGVQAGGARPHICVVFRWLDGRRQNARLSPAHMELVGELMAGLQNHAERFGPPQPFARPRVDGLTDAARRRPDPFAPEIIAASRALIAETLSVQEARQVTDVIERVLAAQQALGQSPATFGLMHADLHHNNLLFARGAVRAIDFDDCGFGPLLYDLAVTLADVLTRPAYPALRAGLLAGYRRVRPLPLAHEACLDAFIALRLVQDGIWDLEARRDTAIDPDLVAKIRRRMAPVAGFLANGGRFS